MLFVQLWCNFIIYWSPLHLAAKWDHPEAAKMLIDAGAHVNSVTSRFEPSFICRTPLELAYLNNRTKVARVLRKAGGDVLPDFLKRITPEERMVLNKFGL